MIKSTKNGILRIGCLTTAITYMYFDFSFRYWDCYSFSSCTIKTDRLKFNNIEAMFPGISGPTPFFEYQLGVYFDLPSGVYLFISPTKNQTHS